MTSPEPSPGTFDAIKNFFGDLDELTLVIIIAGVALYCALLAGGCLCFVILSLFIYKIILLYLFIFKFVSNILNCFFDYYTGEKS